MNKDWAARLFKYRALSLSFKKIPSTVQVDARWQNPGGCIVSSNTQHE